MVKNPSVNSGVEGDADSILGLGRSLGGGNVNPLQYSCLGNSMDRGTWWAPSGRNESDMTEWLGLHACIRNQDLGARCVHYYWVIMASRPFQLTEQGNICVCANIVYCCCCSVTKSCPTLWSHKLNHARLPCPSLSPRVCSNSCPLSQWCGLTISSSVSPFSSCPQSFPASESFLMSRLFISDGQSIGTSASASVQYTYIYKYFCLYPPICVLS